MLHFRMNMPFYLMAFYGSIMIVIVLLLRSVLKNKLPKFVFPVLWCLILLRLLVPFSLSSPLSMRIPEVFLTFPYSYSFSENTALAAQAVFSSVSQPEYLTAAEDIAAGSEFIPDINTDIITSANTDTELASEAVSYSPAGIIGPFFLNWQNILPIAYFIGLAVMIGILSYQKYCCSRRLRGSLLVEHNETINALLRDMDMGYILVFTNDEIASPLVCGLLRPRIYLPTRMDFQNISLLRHILAHETTHIRHRDNWLKTIMLIVLCLNWYNPLVWIMSKCLSSDLETACDAAVLGQCDEDERKSYALSLLAMAITGNRPTMLYSAFSKTEVEKRIKNILNYKKASVFVLLFSILFMAGSTVVFATGGQAPFSPGLTAYCASYNSRWGVRAEITRDISLGQNSQERAENVIFTILRENNTNNPDILEAEMKAALAEEFGVEKGAFDLSFSLCLSREERDEEYAAWDIIRDKDGFYLYQGEIVRTYADKMLGFYQSREYGTVDISVQRSSLGEITSVTALRQGDSEFDRRSEEIKQNKEIYTYDYDTETAIETTVVEGSR